jgi:LPXTG-motif cell wall-anchored protein
VLLGASDGTFTGPTNFPAGNEPGAVAVGDFNADGDPDLAVADRDLNDVAVLLGGPDGTFTGPTSFPAGDRPASVAVGDFNADRTPDLAVANNLSDDVSVLLNDSNQVPIAVDDAYTTPLVVPAPGVLSNDSDPDGDPLTAAVASRAANGTLILNGDGSFTYTPNPGFVGTDSFTYTASDGEATSNPATVTITVVAAGPTTPGAPTTTTRRLVPGTLPATGGGTSRQALAAVGALMLALGTLAVLTTSARRRHP